jgi:heterotetrameric sarcosine oxidase gamma subunit
VAETTPIARSPITQAPPVTLDAGWEVSARRSLAPLRLIDCTPCQKFLIRTATGSAAARMLGVSPGRATHDDSRRLVAGIGHEEWLMVGPPGLSLPSHLTASSDGGFELVTIVEVTHARALIRIVGKDSAKVMSKLCGIDFRDKISPDNTALRTSMAGLMVEIVRNDLANRSPDNAGSDATGLSYLILCERSAGQYLFDVLLDAGKEFGIDIEGFGSSGL